MNLNLQQSMERLSALLGVWKGKGRGEFPTIETFDYSETLVVKLAPNEGFLIYEQSTDLIDEEDHPIRKSHWETGILRPLENGWIELACVQGSGRVEVLHGKFGEQDSAIGGFTLSFESVLVGNDKRVRCSSRDWILTGQHLTYEMKMGTTNVTEPTRHLKARLVGQS